MRSSLTTIRLSIRRNKFLLRILLSYIVTGSILLGALSYVLYGQYSRSFLEEIRKNSENMLDQSYNVVETYWASTINYLSAFHIYSVPSSYTDNVNAGLLFNALFAEKHETIEMGSISRKLIEMVASNPIIESIYVYNEKADKVFSNVSIVQTVDEFFDRDMIGIVRNSGLKPEKTVLPRKVQYTHASKIVEYNAISVVFVEDVQNGRPVSVLVFNLKQDALQQMVQPKEADHASQIFIMSMDGKVISHPQIDMLNSDISKDGDYINRILASSGDRGYFTAMIDGRESLVMYKKSSHMLDWIFVSIGDYNKLLKTFSKISNVVYLLTGLFVVISIATAVVFTRSMVKPLRQLLRKLRTGSGPNPETVPDVLSEYDYLDRMYDNLMRNVSDLTASVREGMPAVKSDFLKKLLQGAVTRKDELEEKIKRFNIRFTAPDYLVCVLRIGSFKLLAAKRSARDLALIRFAVLNIALETFGPDMQVEAVDGESDHVVLIVGAYHRGGHTDGTIRKNLADAQAHIRHYLNLTVTAAVGSPADTCLDIHHSYQNAIRSSNYRLVYGKDAVLFYSDIAVAGRTAYEYPSEREKKLIEALKAADKDKADDIFEQFLDDVRRFTYDEMLLSLTQLALASVGSVPSGSESGPDSYELSYKTIMHQLGDCEDLDDVRAWYGTIADRIVELFKEKREGKSKELIQGIVDYIESRYRDPALTVEDVSAHVQLSPNYVRTIFKNYTDQSLSGYISELRFNEAKRLLLESDHHANKIAEMVGFSGGKYFYYAFKKATGYTPDEFRKRYGSSLK